MTYEKELKIAYWLTIILLLVAVVGYAVPEEEPEEPVRKMFKCIAGKVLFTHQQHSDMSESGYGLACQDCHHHRKKEEDRKEGEQEIKGCGECHLKEVPKTVPQVCRECHEPGEDHHENDEVGELGCKDCHTTTKDKPLPDVCLDCHEEDEYESQEKTMVFPKRSDAFHSANTSFNQCTGCHEYYGQGPRFVEEDCSKCHVK
jgi:hypothetical protein